MATLLLGVIYLAFVSLGLPDSLLGAAWPSMYQGFGVPISYAGGISVVIALGTIISALLSDRMTLRFGAGKVTAASVCLTALALFGFSMSSSYWQLCLLAIPYGLGAGGVDAALNNYVALHYASRHMSWLHCMWGVGASVGPYIMGFALTGGQGWQGGYRYIAILQVVLTVVLVLSIPLWRQRPNPVAGQGQVEAKSNSSEPGTHTKTLSIPEILRIPAASQVFVMFFCYCAIETTAGLWASSYMVNNRGITVDSAASWASMFYIGITVGRALSGFLTMRYSDATMIRIGYTVMACGLLLIMLPMGGSFGVLGGLVVLGGGCAPVYPCIIHSTPETFGADRSQAIVGVQMASAYIGSLLMPPLFGFIANTLSIALFPWYLMALLALMIVMHERMQRIRTRALVGAV
ncbi:MFS transporter [Bifidobacterium crudilactis]|jgi:fucose permease|uniref:MFS transporter n=1 Tax=Bifidobacterium crudilactis TaxID=327277 RepID=UPI0005576C1E|nr:MFS transporter [Bifidobacterium crudilactis]MCI2148048.1 MFS transporter [Bifidobacterium crudilactis]MCI2158021.1 MFS transporter [Bifidobacterium crudilactis]